MKNIYVLAQNTSDQRTSLAFHTPDLCIIYLCGKLVFVRVSDVSLPLSVSPLLLMALAEESWRGR